MPSLLVLFRFYKLFECARERVRIIRALNPGVPIAALYGGPPEDEAQARAQVAPLVDDYAIAEDAPPRWKWLHGDLMIDQWFRVRGRRLPFDVLFEHEADVLYAAPLRELQHAVDSRTIALTGLERLDRVPTWGWLHGEHRAPFQRFCSFMLERFGSAPEFVGKTPLIIGREVLEAFATVDLPPHIIDPILNEISQPALAVALGFRPTDTGYQGPWATAEAEAANRSFLNHERFPIPVRAIVRHLSSPTGRRVFHPVNSQIMIEDLEPFLRLRSAPVTAAR